MNFFTAVNNSFRTNHSTEHAALELADRILYSLDHNETPLSIFFRFVKGLRHIRSQHSLEQIETLRDQG